jgi:hypothetical protein
MVKTKNRNHYIRIFDKESSDCSQDHPKPPAEKAIIDTQVIYGESQSKLPSEERLSSDATAELIELHLKRIKKSWLFTKGRDHGGNMENK